MASGKRDHIVPQMMIRQFTCDDGMLIELIKPDLHIGTRKRTPKSILFRDDGFYRDAQIDWDVDLLQPIEQSFKHYYPDYAHGDPRCLDRNGDAGAALIDWIASMLCRTPTFKARINAVWNEQRINEITTHPHWRVFLHLLPKLAFNYFRDTQFTMYQDMFSRPKWCWRIRILKTESNLVLTDYPVCLINIAGATKPVILVPLTKKRILLGGANEDIATLSELSVSDINLHLAAKAYRSIFAADRTTLESIVRELTGKGEARSPEWMEAACKPDFGLPERMRNTPIPESVNTQDFYESMMDAYGESILPPNRRSGPLSS